MRICDPSSVATTERLSLSFLKRCLSSKTRAYRVIGRAEAAVARNFGRALSVTVVLSLLATSSPTAAPTMVTFVSETERSAVQWMRSNPLTLKLYRGLAYGYVRYRNFGRSLEAESERESKQTASATAVAALLSPSLVVIDAPTNLVVTATSNNSISLSWTAPSGVVDHYQIERSQSPSGPFPAIGTSFSTSFSDPTVSGGSAYLYRVRAVSSGIPSTPSNMALGTAISFTDDPLVASVTLVKAQHITELRQSVNAVRSVGGLGAASWTDTSLSGTFIKAVHIQELRDWLGEALAALSVPATSYTDPVLSTGASGTLVKKAHIEELRQRVSRSSSTSSGSVGGDVSNARLDPLNRTGGGGEDPLSRNFNWSVALVELLGRAGLDLGLSLSHNSLVWTKSGSFISFDDDQGFPSPGFRLGFPVIQPLYFNPEVGNWAYLLITPNGARVELRQVGTSALYEAADSSHLLLDSSTMTLRSTDGTQLSYVWKGIDFQCTQIKDRNGNFITINYTSFGRIDTVVDTLNRTIKFNYDGSNSLTSITQTWTIGGSPVTHHWADFTYSNPDLTIQTNFTGLTNLGPQNGSTLKVLTRVTFSDQSRFDFDYTSWAQVWKISSFATDGHLLNYRSYNLPQNGSVAHTDCPRFTERRDWAKNWNRSGPNGVANLPVGAEQEVVTTYAVPEGTSWTLPDGATQQTGLRTQVTQPDGTYHKIYFHGTAGTSTGWQRGLPTLVETFDSSQVRQKQSVSTWTQDDTSKSYPLNPRVIETNIYDPAGNRARTTVTYVTANHPDGTSCRLPQDVREYQANASTVLRRTHTEYNLGSVYISRRIIGLVSEKTLHEVDPNTQAETLVSKVEFQYDETGSILGTDAPIQHDNTNYTASFVAGRANLSNVKRFNVDNGSHIVTSTVKYNTAGAMVQSADAEGHQTQVVYTDAFAENGTDPDSPLSFATFAYPTTVTDADGFSSRVRYDYDFGSPTWKQTPEPNSMVDTTGGPQQKIKYDDHGRIERVTNLVNNAYTQFNYGPNYVESRSTVNIVTENVADLAQAIQVFDGAGRVIAKGSNHPGSIGGFSGSLVQYDAVGRAIKQSNPTETSISISGVIQPYNWTAAGDDAAGWLYTQQTYDWQGRPLVTTNTDSTTKEASYGGCGCAGGAVVTLTDEGTLFGGATKKRQQKIYSDVLGRTVKTEVLNWDGAGTFGTGGTVYSATVNTYNTRDQVTQIRQYAGPEGSGTFQETTMTYDGHGRLKTRHVPEQNAGANTVWDYNPDDTIQKITDARGASQIFGYNSRHLVTSITYSAPGGSGISIPAAVSFGYDAAGNRTSMSDGSGGVTSQYNQLSQMTAETRSFDGLAGSYPISYEYNLAGALKKMTDPTNMTINYGFDSAGRLNNVAGSDNIYAGVSSYASGLQYRAWGTVKSMTYGNNYAMAQTFDARMLPTQFEVAGRPSQYGASTVMKTQYQYYADGSLKFADDLLDERFDRAFSYDQVAMLKEGYSGAEARDYVNGTSGSPWTGPFGRATSTMLSGT